MENTKIIFKVQKAVPVSLQAAELLVKSFRNRISHEIEGYKSPFVVSGDTADKLTLVEEELAVLNGVSGQTVSEEPEVEVVENKKVKKDKKKDKKRTVEDVEVSTESPKLHKKKKHKTSE